MAGELFDLFARQVCAVANAPRGNWSAEELTDFTRRWPMPAEGLSLMNMSYDDIPIVFHDVSFKYMADWLLELFRDGLAVFPIGLMPAEHIADWEEDIQVKTFKGFLGAHNLGIQMVAEENAVSCRGEWVHPCDFRPIFLSGHTVA